MRKNFYIKKLYGYLLKTYIPSFLMTFAICLFLVLMQFLWKYIEDFVGKGLGIGVLGEMFLYAALTLIPLALPLSILLASLMVFGNLGETLELLSIKSAGIPLLKMMKPLIFLVIFISIGAFFFQNNAMPKIQSKFVSLLISIRQKSPELDIPEGVFYKEISGYNVYVGKKDPETGMLHDVLIYDMANGFQNMAVIICDSAKMHSSEDKLSLIFTMYNGQQFQNFTEGTAQTYTPDFVPYARESFDRKTMTIHYDDNFNRMDENVIQENVSTSYATKNMTQLQFSIDSLQLVVDSANVEDRKVMHDHSYLNFRISYARDVNKKDSIMGLAKTIAVQGDSLFAEKNLKNKVSILQSAYSKAESNGNDFLFRTMNKSSLKKTIIRYWIEWHRKFTLSFACLIFFFIGAPLGSIVRKGGLGTPIVISVILFIVYYILDNVGYKMARDGVWEHWIGMWFSSFILLGLGIFLTYKAMNDSVIMNSDTYLHFIKKMLFIREKRAYTMKEVIIDEPNPEKILLQANQLSENINTYLQQYSKLSYQTFWSDNNYAEQYENIRKELENILSQLSNSRKSGIIETANQYPVLIAHIKPFAKNRKLSNIFRVVFPIGFVFKLLSLPFEKRIATDLRQILKKNQDLQSLYKEE